MSDRFQLNRRTFLRGAGAALALPSLECMLPGGRAAAAALDAGNPRRFLAVHVALGLHPAGFFPGKPGAGYELPELLRPLAPHRDDFTIISGLDHPGVTGGHRGIVTFLTGVNVFGFSGYDFKNTQSVDQLYAEHVGSETRYSSLQLATSGNRSASSWDVSWSREGIALQPYSRPRDVFQKLFGKEAAANPDARRREFERKTSLLDRVLDQAKSLDRRLGEADRAKMDEYLTAVREVERRIEKAEDWATKPKPRIDRAAPKFNSNSDPDMFENMRIMYELIGLAFETDSTRSIVLQIPANNAVFRDLDGVTQGYHALSHHGKEEEKIRQLIQIERQHTTQLAGFLDRMKAKKEHGERLLDSTTVLMGSGLGNASSHSNKDLPILVAGGGYKSHGQHLAYRDAKSPPLSNLYVSMLQNLGVETDRFAASTGTLRGFA